jgi:DNA-binding response OmpR family regulator
LLTEFGYRVAAISGADELEMVLSREQGFDLLITDVVLPGTKNGREVAELVRASIPGVKVIFVSGYTRDAITTNDRMLPGADFLAKPFTQDAILKRIREILDRS